MALKKDVGLGMRLVYVMLIREVAIFVRLLVLKDWIGQVLCQLAQEWLFTVSDRHLAELTRLADKTYKPAHLLLEERFIFEVLCEESDCLVFYSIETRDTTDVSWLYVELVFGHNDALRSLEILNSLLNKLTQEIIDVLGCAPTQVVVVRVRG